MPTAKLNFADQIYQLFKSSQTTTIKYNDLYTLYTSQYGEFTDLHIRLRDLAFIQFDRTGAHKFKETILFLVIELDDICIKCRPNCRLIHTLNPKDKFKQTYRNTHNTNNNPTTKLSTIKIPNIRLFHRLKSILNDPSIGEMKLHNVIRIHNEKYPAFKSHEPTSQGISIRYRAHFLVMYNEYKPMGEHIIKMKQPIDCNNSVINEKVRDIFDVMQSEYFGKHIISIDLLNNKLQDNKLIPDLIEYIYKQTKKKVCDIYMKDSVRLGYFTSKSNKIAQLFIDNCRDKQIKYYGRILTGTMVSIPKNDKHNHIQKGHRVRISNLPAIISIKQYEDWVYKITNVKKKHLIYDSLMIYPKRPTPNDKLYALFNTKKDCIFVMKKINNIIFRGATLKLKYIELNSNNKSQSIAINNNNNKIKKGITIIHTKKARTKQGIWVAKSSGNKWKKSLKNGNKTPPVSNKTPPIKASVAYVSPKHTPKSAPAVTAPASPMTPMSDGSVRKSVSKSQSVSIETKEHATDSGDDMKMTEEKEGSIDEGDIDTKMDNNYEELNEKEKLIIELARIKKQTDLILTPNLVNINKFIKSFESNSELISNSNRTFINLQSEQSDILLKIKENERIYETLKHKLNKIMSCERIKEILNKLAINGSNFNNILFEISECIISIEQSECIINCILEYGIINMKYINMCVDLCTHLCSEKEEYLEIIVNETRRLFVSYKLQRYLYARNKYLFFGVMILIGELFNVGLFKINLVFQGVLNNIFDDIKSNENNKFNQSLIDCEGIAKLLLKCYKLLDGLDSLSVDKYIKALILNMEQIEFIQTTEKHKYEWNRINNLIIKLKWKREYNNLQIKYTKLEGKYTNLQDKYTQNDMQYNNLQNKYSNILSNHKLLQIKFNELGQKYMDINKKFDYKLWDFNDITNWIISLDKNGNYIKYKEILIKNLKNESIDGTCLINIDKNDLHRLGITQFKHKYEIYLQIQELIQKNKNINKNLCKICQENICKVACIPCGHVAICQMCANQNNSNNNENSNNKNNNNPIAKKICPICQNKYDALQLIHL